MRLLLQLAIGLAIFAGRDFAVAKKTKNNAIVGASKELVVGRGSITIITKRNLEIFANESIVCRIEVVFDPICLRFGKLSANKFTCDFNSESVQYLHSGSLTSNEDCVKLKLLLFYESRTEKETVKLKVVVQNLQQNDVLSKPLLNIMRIGGMESFGAEIVPISAKKFITSCNVSLLVGEKWPANGKVSALTNATSWKCLDFMATYLHDGSYIPNIDYVPLIISWREPLEGEKKIRYHLKVGIQGAQDNEQPAIYSRRPRLIVRQYSVTQIQTSHVRAYDYKTAPADLILKISSLTKGLEGHFGSVENPSEALEGVTQEMIESGKVLFIAPKNDVVRKRRRFSLQQFHIQAIDPYGGISKRTLRMLFFVRKFIAHYLSVVKNQPMHVLEGSSCALSEENLEVACPGSNCNAVVFSIIEEPKYGGMFVNSRKVTMFTFDDLASGRIIYKHDNSENHIDNIIISVTDRSQLAFATMNVVIEPIDDSPPFLSVHKDIIAKSGRFSKIESAALQASDPDSDVTMILFKLTVKPKKGHIVKRINDGSFVKVDEFSEIDLESGRIYYEATSRDYSSDEFTFVLSDGGAKPNLSKEYIARVKLIAVDTTPPHKRHAGDCLVYMNETEASLSLNFIDYNDNQSPSSDIVIQIQQSKENDLSRVRNEDVVRRIGYKNVHVTNFTQQQLFHNKILLLNRHKEVGKHSKSLQIDFFVSDRDNNKTPLQTCTIIILPVDNKAPYIFLKDSISVFEGGRVCIKWPTVTLMDEDTPVESLRIILEARPKNGVIVYRGKNVSEEETIYFTELKQHCIWYYHSGSETLRDAFSIVASDGINNKRSDVTISITPVNDQRPRFVNEVASIKVMENSSVVIDAESLAAVDGDSNSSTFSYYVTKKPKRGHLDVKGAVVTSFSHSQLTNDLIVYIHNQEEVGSFPGYDNFTVVVCDDVAVLENSSSAIVIRVEIVPVNSIPPVLGQKREVVVDEGKSAVIDDEILGCQDRDTIRDEIHVGIISFPRFGYLENAAPSEGSEKSNAGKRISEFKCSDLSRGSVYYVQSNHSGFEPIEDKMVIIAFDGSFNSTPVQLKVKIRPTNDEKPLVKQMKIANVQEGGWKLIDQKYISIQDKDIPKDTLKYYVKKPPKHGRIFYKCNGAGSPRLQSLRRLQRLDYKKCAMIYVHDDSETVTDAFHIEATDGLMTSGSRVRVNVVPVNDQWPKILNNVIMTVRFGGLRNITRSYLTAQDLDTEAKSLTYRVTSLPRYGSLKLMVNGKPVKLATNATFTQDDVNMKLISYINHIMPVQGLIDAFKFSLSDGVHVISNQTFTLRIRLSCRKKFKLKTKSVIVNGPRVFITSSNLKVERKRKKAGKTESVIMIHIIKQPSHGVLEFTSKSKSGKVTFVSLADLAEKQLTYRSFEYPLSKNDTLRFFATDGKCMQRGRLRLIGKGLNATVKAMKKISTLHISKRGVTVITPLEIRALDKFNAKKVLYTMKKLPQSGVIVKNSMEIKNFTQEDVNDLQVSYSLLKEQAKMDQVLLEVVVKDYYGLGLDSKPEEFPLDIRINIPAIRDVHVITNQGITSLESLKKHGKGGVITNRNLLSYNCSSKLDLSLRYKVIEPPVHGELVFKDSGQPATTFTQADINNERVAYKLTDFSHTDFSDMLLLDVGAEGCRKQTGVKFNINWSLVSLSDKLEVKCKNGQPEISVNLTRRGYLSQGSVVELFVKSLTDPSQILQPTRIWFYPGDRVRSWRLPGEVLEYETAEVSIYKEFNTLLGRNKIKFDIATLQDACSTKPRKNQKDKTEGKTRATKIPDEKNPNQFHAISFVRTASGKEKIKFKAANGDKSRRPTSSSRHCGKGWFNFREKCYLVIKRLLSWKKATKFCRKRNSSLYIPTSAEEEKVVKRLSEQSPFWIGIRINKRGLLKWSVPANERLYLQTVVAFRVKAYSKNTCVYLDEDANMIAAGCKLKMAFAVCKKSI